MKVMVIINAAGGTAMRLGQDALHGRLAEAFAAQSVTAQLTFVPGSDLTRAAEAAAAAVKAGTFDAVVAGGGDGTIRSVAQVLADTGIALGILPLGTLNHFARDLKIPFAPEEAVAIIASGRRKAVDLGAVNGEIFLNNSSIGLYPTLVLQRERRRRRTNLPKWLAMLLALPAVLRHLPLFRLRVRIAGHDAICRSPILFVGNNEYRLTLPEAGTREHLDRGELAVYITVLENRLALIGVAWRALLGRTDARHLRVLKGKAAEIGARRHRVLVAFDGEVDVLHTPLRYTIHPGALTVLVPEASS